MKTKKLRATKRSSNRIKTRLLLHVIMPLVIGGAIYVCWRDSSLLMFDWFRQLGLGPVVDGIRTVTLPAAVLLPRWVLYSLPDALWVYAAIMFMHRIWVGSESRTVNRRLWLWSGPVLAVVIEFAQLTGVIPGSFDPNDLILSAAAAGTAALVVINFGKSRIRNEKGTEYVQANKNEFAVGSRA